jgi:hypothetical protein
MNVTGHRSQVAGFIIVLCAVFLTLNIVGCEAFVRKFTRKPKKDKIVKEELVLLPQEYAAPQMTNEELFQQYFLFWRSWQDELIESLSSWHSMNHKKQVSCAKEAMENLRQVAALLQGEPRGKIEVFVDRSTQLYADVLRDVYGSRAARNRQTAERIKRSIMKDFPFQRIKDNLIAAEAPTGKQK